MRVNPSTLAEFEDAIRRIGDNDPSVTEFTVGGRSRLPETLTKDDIDQFLVALSKNTHLNWLVLSSYSFGDDHARRLSKIIMNSALPLTTLWLSRCKLRHDGAEAFSKALVGNSTLKDLDLHLNEIGDLGAFAKALEDNNTLEIIRLRNNIIGCKGARALSTAIKKNTTISHFYLPGNPIKEAGLKALEDTMRVNTTITDIILHCNDAKCKSIIESIKGMASRNRVLGDHRKGVKKFGTEFYVLRVGNNRAKYQWAPPRQNYSNEGDDPKPIIWEALTADGMTLQLVLDVFSKIVKNGPRDVAALKVLVETERDEHGDTLLHAAAAKDSSAAVDLCLFLIDEVGLDAHGILNQSSRSAFNVSDRKMPILKKMEYARLCRDARNADAYAGALIDIVEEPRGVESALYYLIQEKPEVVNPTFWNASK